MSVALPNARLLEAFGATRPRTILVVMLTPTKTWPLADDIAAGCWSLAGEVKTARA